MPGTVQLLELQRHGWPRDHFSYWAEKLLWSEARVESEMLLERLLRSTVWERTQAGKQGF